MTYIVSSSLFNLQVEGKDIKEADVKGADLWSDMARWWMWKMKHILILDKDE